MSMAILTAALAVGAVDASTGGQPPRRISSVTLARGQACPVAGPGEVVVCRPAEDPYRIPNALRPSAIAERTTSWVDRAADIDETSRVAAGLPDSCSVVGTGGQTGCTQAMLRRWAAERRAARTAP